jgi:PncC family amidohydrolase
MHKIITENKRGYNLTNHSTEVNVPNSLEIRVGSLLQERGLKLVLAESCTGGLLGSRITDVPGSSEYFLGSVVAYAYETKVAILGVSWDTLNGKGAVSRETVLEMARGIRTAMKADISMAVSGIAGPGGGTPEKPVGTTWIGLITEEAELAQLFHFRQETGRKTKPWPWMRLYNCCWIICRTNNLPA